MVVKSQLHTNSLQTSAPPFLNVAWHSTAQCGWAWHREPDHLADANCDV